MIRRSIVVAAAAVFLGAVPLSAVDAAEAPGFGTYVDVHMHFNNALSSEWVQEQKQSHRGPGDRASRGERPPRGDRHPRGDRPPQGEKPSAGFTDADYLACADNLIRTMDQYGIRKAVLMPQPHVTGHKGSVEYTKLLPAIRKYPDRLVLGAGGDTLNAIIHDTKPTAVTNEVREKFRAEAEKIVADGAKVFGELTVLHLSMNPQHPLEAVDADHPLFLLLADIAAKHGMPIDIHMEAVVEDSATPENLRRASSNNPPTLKATIPGFERLLAHNRNAKIVWQHIGWDNTGQMTIDLLRRMLNAHPNLYLGFEVEDRTNQIGSNIPMPNRMVDEQMRLKPEWRRFFTDHADRLMLATDEFVGAPGKSRQGRKHMEETFGAIRQLPEDVLLKVARDNAVRIYNLK